MRHLSTASEGAEAMSQELFRVRLDGLIDLSHPLSKLTRAIPWAEIEALLTAMLPPAPAGAGRPALPIRLMAGLLYLKHTYNLSDEATCERWLENYYWQYFTGEVYFQTRLPCDPSSLTRWRNLVNLAQQEEITLRQSYEREGPSLRRRAGGYAHAKQSIKRLNRVLRRQRTVLGRLIRDIERKIDHATASISLRTTPERAEQLPVQHRQAKGELYALHALEVECISKGKSRHPYEFGVKMGLAVIAKIGLIVGARSFPGNPYDGDTLAEQLEQAEILSGEKPHTAIVDLGYRGRSLEGGEILHRGNPKRLTRPQWSWV